MTAGAAPGRDERRGGEGRSVPGLLLALLALVFFGLLTLTCVHVGGAGEPAPPSGHVSVVAVVDQVRNTVGEQAASRRPVTVRAPGAAESPVAVLAG